MRCCYLIVVVSFCIASCTNESVSTQNYYTPAVIETNGYEVPVDCVKAPIITPLDESTLLISRVGEPTSFATNTNIFRAGTPEIKIGSAPTINTPGKDTFLLPEIIAVIDSAFLAGIPEISTAKDAYTKDQNPQNFSTFNKLQGLKHGNIRCLLEDHLGNIWLGTEGGGVSKYDGKLFTHYTENQGLSYNDVRCVLQDKNNHIWFGTNGGGISSYDGKKFHHYKSSDGLSDDDVLCMTEDSEGWGHTNDIAHNFKAIDFYKDFAQVGDDIFAETVVSMKTTTTTNVDNWLASNPVKSNLDNLEIGKLTGDGVFWNGTTIKYNAAEVHIYMPQANITPQLKTEWLNKLASERPEIIFKINALEDFVNW